MSRLTQGMSRLKQSLPHGWVDLGVDMSGPVTKWIKGKLEVSRRKEWMSRLNQGFLELSRPGSRPVLTRGNMVQRKKENESTQGVSESTHSSFLELSQPVRTRGFCVESWVDSPSWNLQKMSFFCNVTPFLYVRNILGIKKEGIGPFNENEWT